MLKLVETVRTSCSKEQLVQGFVDGWTKAFGKIPSKESIGVLYAQNALETGATTFMWNWNIGNIKAVDKPNETVEYMMLANVWEIINGKKVIYQPPHQATWFRSFNSLGEGVSEHFNFLKNYRYKNAWTAIESGNPSAFAHLLKVAGYYTAPESDYVKAMNLNFSVYMRSGFYEKAVSNNPQVNTWKKIGNAFANFFK